MDDAHSGISDNIFYDFVRHDGAIWASTGRGVTYSTDGGITWNFFDTTNGLPYNEITALHSSGDTLWVAVNSAREDPATRSVVLDGEGIAFTDNNGDIWNVMEPEGTVDFRRTVYELKGVDSIISFAAWAGGLGVTFDNGQNWKKVYYSYEDSVDYASVLSGSSINILPPTNLYFATAVDTFHQDTMMLWAGSADGLMRYLYTPRYARLSSMQINYLGYGADYMFICGDSGLTRAKLADGRTYYHSVDETDGLTGGAATSAYMIGDYLLVGTLDQIGGDTPGLSRSVDTGLTFSAITSGLSELDTGTEYPEDFATMGDYVFMAAFEAGLYKSADSGATWTAVALDADPTSLKNVVHSVDRYLDSLWIGTDTGIVLATIDTASNADILTDTLFPFVDSDTSGARCTRIRIDKYYNTAGDAVDSTAVWAIQHPIDSMVGEYAVYYTNNAGTNWYVNTSFLLGAKHFDVGFFENIVMLTGDGILRYAPNNSIATQADWGSITGASIRDSLHANNQDFSLSKINAILVLNDTLIVGADSGLGVSPPGGDVFSWGVTVPDDDLTDFTAVDRYTVDDGLSGNFVNAMEVQLAPGGDTLVWASTHAGASGGGEDGISMSPADGSDWQIVHTGTACWNFAFNGDTAFAATNAGLLMTSDKGVTWDTLDIAGIIANYPVSTPYSIDSEMQVIGVLVDNDTLWVGTEAGAASIDLNDMSFENWSMFRAYDSTAEVYAYPVPYAPTTDGTRLYFHYPVPADAYVTLEVYDFAMDLVKTVVDNEFRTGGPGVAWMTDSWDGYNGKGDLVAAGIYHFKVTLSTGEVYWGKLAIEP